jgi:hypothetical protein
MGTLLELRDSDNGWAEDRVMTTAREGEDNYDRNLILIDCDF